jgi:glycosyltransferase involved in cell wall biosynthesis
VQEGNKIKIVIIYRVFSNYRKPVFDKLREKFELFVLDGNKKSTIKKATANYSESVKQIFLSNKETNVYLACISSLRRMSPDIVVHEFAIGIISMPIVAIWCWLNNKKLALWSHGYNRKKGFSPKRSFLDKYRLWWMKKCNALIVYGDKDKKLLSKYINADKIFVAKNTLDTDRLLRVKKILQDEGKECVKVRIGFSQKFNLIYIGRLLVEKLPQLLVEMIQYLPKEIIHNLNIHYVGDGTAKETLKELVENKECRDIFKFHGSIHDEFQTGSLLFASDLMILPGEIGLSVNHAFCFDCPVITFKRKSGGPFHGPEEEYIINGVTGFQLEEHSAIAIARQVTSYLGNIEIQNQLRSNISTYVESDLSVDNMVRGFEDAINYVIAK